MGDMREDFDALKEHNKQKHGERVAKTPSRVEYAIKQFEQHDIEYQLKNPEIGHFPMTCLPLRNVFLSSS